MLWHVVTVCAARTFLPPTTTISVHPTATHACGLVSMTRKCPERVRNSVRRPLSVVGVSGNSRWVMSAGSPVRVFFVCYLTFWIQWHPYGTLMAPVQHSQHPLRCTHHHPDVPPHSGSQRRPVLGHVISRDLARCDINFVTYFPTSSQV